MPTIRRFEDLNVWKAARVLVNLVYEKSSKTGFAKDFALRDQIRKAAISVMSNIAEGLDAGYDKEFIRFLGFSFRSASEVQSQLYTALDLGYIDNSEFETIYAKAVDTKKQTRKLVSYLASNLRGGRIAREAQIEYVTDLGGLSEAIDLPSDFLATD
jgi:four helix bundle protein